VGREEGGGPGAFSLAIGSRQKGVQVVGHRE